MPPRWGSHARCRCTPTSLRVGSRRAACWRRRRTFSAIAEARRLALEVIASTEPGAPRVLGSIDPRVSMRIVLARVDWLEARPVAAWRWLDECLALASDDVGQATCQALAWAACPLALWTGDRDASHRHVAALHAAAKQFGLPYYDTWASLYERVLTPDGDSILSLGLDRKQRDLAWTLPGAPAPEPIEAARARAQDGEAGWCAAELMRRAAGVSDATTTSSAAGELLEQALELAERQGTTPWALRSVLDLIARDGPEARWLSVLGRCLTRYADARGPLELARARAAGASLEPDVMRAPRPFRVLAPATAAPRLVG